MEEVRKEGSGRDLSGYKRHTVHSLEPVCSKSSRSHDPVMEQ